MTRAVISGYFGFHNLGDEAILFSMLQALQEQYPGFQAVVLSNDPDFTARTYGVEAVNRWKAAEIIPALQRADLLISGGGSLLQDVTGLKSLVYYLGIIWLARSMGKPVVFYAQGIGPVNSSLGRRMVASTANKVAAITVRDEESRQDLLEMGVIKDVTVTADPVLGVNPETVSSDQGQTILQQAGLIIDKDLPAAGISVRPWAGQWQQAVAAACDRMVEKGMQVVFLPMHHPVDIEISREVASMMKFKSLVLERDCSVSEILSVVSNLRLLVGMRLHALIFAAAMGVHPVGISYDPKVERFLGQLGLEPAGTPDNLNSEMLLNSVGSALSFERKELLARVAPLRQKALETVKIIEVL